MTNVTYFQLLLQLGNRMIDAPQDAPAQARVFWTVHGVPRLDELCKFAELNATWGDQLGQHLAVQADPGAFLRRKLETLGSQVTLLLLVLGGKDQLAALLRGQDAARRSRASRGPRPGRILACEVPEVLVLLDRVSDKGRRGDSVL